MLLNMVSSSEGYSEEQPVNLEQLYEQWSIDDALEPEFQDGPQNQTIFRRQMNEALVSHTDDSEVFLTRAEEQELARVIEAGAKAELELSSGRRMYRPTIDRLEVIAAASKEAQHKLVECNMRFAAYYARASMGILKGNKNDPYERERIATSTFMDVTSLRSPEASLEDRVQIAMIGLLKAAEKFRPHATSKTKNGRKQPPRFTTLASWYIVSELSREIPENEYSGLRLPVNKVDGLRKFRRVKRQAFELEGRELTIDELAVMFDMAPESIARMEYLLEATSTRYPLDMDTGITAYEEYDTAEEDSPGLPGLRLEDIVSSREASDVLVEGVVAGMGRRAILAVFDTLSEREAGVLLRRFDLIPTDNTDMEWNLDTIGKVYGVTRERARQIESKAMSKVRHPSRSDSLKPVLQVGGLIELDFSQKASRSERPARYAGVGAAHLGRTVLGRLLDESVYPAQDRDPSLESWQTFAGESWELPTRKVTRGSFVEFMAANLEPLDFARVSRREETSERRPYRLLETLDQEDERPFSLQDLERSLPSVLRTIISTVEREAPERDLDGKKIGLFLSKIIGDALRSHDDAIRLTIPDELDGKIEMFGKGMIRGEVRIVGNLGDFAGYEMGGLSRLVVDGSVGDSCGYKASDGAIIAISGDAGYSLGRGARNEVGFGVEGTIESLALHPQFKGTIDCGRLRRHGVERVKHGSRIRQHSVA